MADPDQSPNPKALQPLPAATPSQAGAKPGPAPTDRSEDAVDSYGWGV